MTSEELVDHATAAYVTHAVAQIRNFKLIKKTTHEFPVEMAKTNQGKVVSSKTEKIKKYNHVNFVFKRHMYLRYYWRVFRDYSVKVNNASIINI